MGQVSDVVTAYTLSSGGGTVIFNNGDLGDGTDKYWLTSGPKGLHGTLRTPFDNVPFGDGGQAHTSRRGPMLPIFEGTYLIESSHSQALCQQLRNEMASALDDVLQGMLAPTAGTLSWTPVGLAARSLSVFYWVPLDDPYGDNFLSQNFTFGLFSGAPTPT